MTAERALLHDVAVAEVGRDVILASGPDTISFLQGQLSQDVQKLQKGASALSFVLQPQGKVDALLRVTRVADDAVHLDVDAGHGAAVVERLERFKLRTKCELEVLPEWKTYAIRGPRSHAVRPADADLPSHIRAMDSGWTRWPGFDLIGAEAEPPDGVSVATADEWEAARIRMGIPVLGREIDERTIPAEAGPVDDLVSFTKGCYTGQELVARIDSRGGNVPRHLRVVTTDGVAEVGAEVVVDGKVVGTVTSAAWSADLGRGVALAYVGRAVDGEADATVAGGAARIHVVPLLG